MAPLRAMLLAALYRTALAVCPSWCTTWECDGSEWCKHGATPEACQDCPADTSQWCEKPPSGHTKAIRAKFGRPNGFASCAIVGSSGLLLESRLGAVIDEHEFVMRTNLAPVGGFEEIVGSKTTLRVMNSEAIDTFLLERACPKLRKNDHDSSFCPHYAVHINSDNEGPLRSAFWSACRKTPGFTGRNEVPLSDAVVRHFASRTGGNVMTGAWGIALAFHLCPNGINAYGYTHAGTASLSKGAPYHCPRARLANAGARRLHSALALSSVHAPECRAP